MGLYKFISHKDARQKELVDKLGRGMEKAVLLVEGEAKKNCPVDTGRLRSSITGKVTEEYVGIIGTDVEYAPFVEHGTSRQSAQPFLFPALESSKKKIAELLKNG